MQRENPYLELTELTAPTVHCAGARFEVLSHVGCWGGKDLESLPRSVGDMCSFAERSEPSTSSQSRALESVSREHVLSDELECSMRAAGYDTPCTPQRELSEEIGCTYTESSVHTLH